MLEFLVLVGIKRFGRIYKSEDALELGELDKKKKDFNSWEKREAQGGRKDLGRLMLLLSEI